MHSSQPEPILNFTHGALRLNETRASRNDPGTQSLPQVDMQTIFKTQSITKAFTTLGVFVVQCQSGNTNFNMNSRLADYLPSFRLPDIDWENGGSEITFDMLSTHSSGLPREGYSTNFSLSNPDSVGATSGSFLGRIWSQPTPDSITAYLAQRGLSWQPGQRPSYSNVGFALLGFAVASFASTSSASTISWTDWTTTHLLAPLNLTGSYIGAAPPSLRSRLSIPADAAGFDIAPGAGYDPAAGLCASTADLAAFLHHVLLKRTPALITPAQRNMWLTPRFLLGDGLQGVGQGWEIDYLPTAATGPLHEEIYGKTGDGSGSHASISVLPALGYGVVALESQSTDTNYTGASAYPSTLALTIHAALAPAFRQGFAQMLRERFEGTYGTGDSSAQLGIDATGNLRLYNMTWKGASALRLIDALSWMPGASSGPEYFDNDQGVVLHPSWAVGKEGVWHMAVDPGGVCDWESFTGYVDENDVALDEVRLIWENGDARLSYDALGANYTKTG